MGFHVFTVALLYIHFAPTVVCWLAFAPLERLLPWWRARHPPLEPPVPIPPRAVRPEAPVHSRAAGVGRH
ncbi:MAG: hypothetical protein ACRYG2_36215, partial [Janthinobacterium lividum]